MKIKTFRNLILSVGLLLLVFGMGYRVGLSGFGKEGMTKLADVSGKNTPATVSVDFTLFWDVWDRLNRYYIDKKALDAQKLVYGAISGMVSSLGDPYTVFLPPDQNKDAKDDLGGKFEGIGAQLGVKDKKIVVIAPLKGTPAEKAGLAAGDWIVKVDGQVTSSWTLPEAVSKIRGPKGSKVVLTVIHKEASSSAEVAVVRDEIKVASVEWEIKNAKCETSNAKCSLEKEDCSACLKVVYLRLSRFGDQTNEEWIKAVDEVKSKLENEGKGEIKGLVFDLRNNPGGYLAGSVFIASEFLSDGTVVLQEGARGQQQKYTVTRKGKLLTIPLVVLINKGSASASEIVAGALKDRGRGKLVGETSFGKGTIQDAQELSAGSGIHITTAKWLLPSGKWVNGNGIDPDVKIELDEKKPEEDLQLEKAVEILIK